MLFFSHSGEMFSLNRDQIVIGMPAGEGEKVYIVRTGKMYNFQFFIIKTGQLLNRKFLYMYGT
jgi:hypothetical protein